MNFSTALLNAARGDIGSPNDYNVPGVFCSAAVREWIQKASRAQGIKPPIPGCDGAKATMAQLQKAGYWLGKVRPQPGMIAVWNRGDPTGYQGHIGIVETSPDSNGMFGTIEANAAPVVSRFKRDIKSPTLIGFGGVGFSSSNMPILLAFTAGCAILYLGHKRLSR